MSSSYNTSEPIAVIGIGCRFPGASSLTELVEVLSDPADLSQTIPSNRFSIDSFHHDTGSHHGSTNVRKSYFLQENIRKFDNNFFNITAVEAFSIDPQQRILLETVHEAFENANVSMPQLRGSDTAVYVGLMCGDYENILNNDLEAAPRYQATGVARSIIANRISYIWDLHGPSMTIDTACSSSLVALHQGVQALRLGECKLAVAAGSNLLLGPECYITESKLNMLSPTGNSRMWDAEADGYARGEGVAAVVLKRLSDAVADGDFIECIVRETGVGQDGHTNGITTPGSESQASLIRRVYAKAGLDVIKDGCQYFEAHGTGTPAGDPVEAEAIHSVFINSSRNDLRTDPLYVGSVKTVIGHTEGTAGLAGLIKTAAALQRKTIFPNKHFNKLSPSVAPFYRNLKVPTVEVPWPKTPHNQPRRASVNSFGFGGTNSHVILESYENSGLSNRASGDTVPLFVPVILSAKSAESLYGGLADYNQWLNLHPEANIRDVAITAARRSPFAYRTAITSASGSELSSKLSEAIRERRVVAPTRSNTPRTIGIFTGQGAQSFGMMAEVLRASPWAQSRARQLEETLLDMIPLVDRPTQSLVDQLLLGRSSDDSSVMEARLSQPLCTMIQILLVDILRTAGINFSAVVGHSSGEMAAAYAAGYLTAESALGAAYYRGMHTNLAGSRSGQQGAMLAASMSYKEACKFCERPEFKGRLCVAASNSPGSVTLSGDEDAIVEAEESLNYETANAKRLVVDKAYHSHHMNPCSSAYLESLRALPGFKPDPDTSTRWFSSVNVREASKFHLTADYWNNNMVQPVLFSQALEKACREVGSFDVVVEIGPHPALRGPVTQTLQNLEPQNTPAYAFLLRRGQDSVQSFREGFAQLWEAGLNPKLADVDKLMSGVSGQALRGFPIYHWQHDQEFWHETRFTKAFRRQKQPIHPLIGKLLPDSSDLDMRWRNVLLESELPWLAGHKIQGQTVFPATGYLCMAVEAAQRLVQNNQDIQTIDVINLDIAQALLIPQDDPGVEVVCTITNVRRPAKTKIMADFSLYSALGDSLFLKAKATVELRLGPPKGDILPFARQQGIVDCLMSPIDSDIIYSAWNSLGYGYTGPFRAIQNASRKLNVASGSIVNTPGDGSMLFHPATLDAAIQTILLAYCHPEDGGLFSTPVPRTIGNVRIDFGLAKAVGHSHPNFGFATIVPDREGSGVSGDVELFTQEGQGIVQIEAIHCVQLSPATEESDSKTFYRTKWAPALPDAKSVCWDGQATADDYELAENLERLCFYYMTQLEKTLPRDHPQRQHPNWKRYFGFLAHVLSLVDSGDHPHVKKDWLQDTSEVVTAIAARYPDNLNRRVIEAVGDNIAQVVFSGGMMLEHPLRGLLDDYYAGMADPSYTRYLARVVGQLAVRFPAMNILEIGAGNGSVTKTIFEEIGCTFDTYTCTDVSISRFEKASDTFPAQKDRTIFSSLDLERNFVQQGFKSHSYDLVVASLALHATSNLKNTLSNVRSLLRPGGHLVMLEITDNNPIRIGFVLGTMQQWWIGEAEGRVLSPCIEPSEWNAVLQQSGFSSIDSTTPDVHRLPFPFSVITAQAVDERVQLLRNPLANKTAFPRLLVVGGATANTAQLVSSLCGLLGQHYEVVLNIRTLADFSEVYSGCTVLSLAELDGPVFENINDRTLSALKTIMSTCAVLLWITHGARDRCPESMMAIGFFRTMLWEMPDLNFRSIDFLDASLPDSHVICSSLLELEMGVSWDLKAEETDILWPLERELIYKNGRLEIPRVIPSPDLNDRYNASRRLIVRKNGNRPIRLSPKGWLEQDASVHLNKALALSKGKRLQLKVEYSTSFSVPILDSGLSNLYLVFGRVANSSRPVLAMVPECASIAKPLPCSVCEVQDDCSPSLVLTQVASILQAVYLLSHVPKGQRLLVHNPRTQLALAIKYLAKDRGIRVTLTSTDQQTKFIYLHPFMPARLIKSRIGPPHHYFADLSKPTEFLKEASIRELLPKSTIIIATQPITACDDFRLATSSPYGSSLEPAQAVPAYTQLSAAYSLSHGLSMHSLQLVSLSDFSSQQPNLNKNILMWNDTESALTRVLPTGSHLSFLPHRTYWLLGLTGGMGLSLTEWLVQKGAQYVALSSRDPRISPEWLENQRKAGVTISVIPCDITDKASLNSAYEKIKDSLPPLAGVAQGAMVLEDVPVEDLDAQKVAKVAGPKVAGSRNLDRLFEEHGDDLDFFILFSSAVATIGNHGQSSYTAANTFMQSLALQRRHRGRAASVLNLGLVIGTGYAMNQMSRSQRETLGKNGARWISEDDVHHAFGEAVLASPSSSNLDHEITLGLETFPAGGSSAPPWAEDPRLSHLFTVDPNISRESKASGADAPRTPLERLAAAPSLMEAELVIKESFLAELQSSLKLSPAQMEAEKTLLDSGTDQLGFDSLIGVEVRRWFLKTFNIKIATHQIMNTNLQGIIDLALSKLDKPTTPNRVMEPESMPQENETSSPLSTSEFGSPVTESSSPSSRSSVDLKSPDIPAIDLNKAQYSPRYGPHPLSINQEMFWFVQKLMPDANTLNGTVVYRMTGSPDIARLSEAVRVVGKRHEAMRTAIYELENGTAVQAILDDATVHLETLSASHDDIPDMIQSFANHRYKLDQGQNMRILLVSSSPTEHHLFFGSHHINLDGISLQIIQSELEAFYKGDDLLGSPLQFADFARRQSENDWSDLLSFWYSQLSGICGELPILQLPDAAKVRQPLNEYRTTEIGRRVNSSTMAKVSARCRELRVTQFQFYLAIFRVLLVRLAKVDDICIGIADANRLSEDTIEAVGMYLNLLPLRFLSTYNKRFSDIAQATKQKVQSAISHSALPFGLLLSNMGKLGLRRSAEHSPVFQAFVDYRQGAREQQPFGDCNLDVRFWQSAKAAYDIGLDIVDSKEVPTYIRLATQDSLYSKADAELLMDSYMNLVDAFATSESQEECLIESVPMFDGKSIGTGLSLAKGNLEPSRWPATLAHRVVEISATYPGKPAIKDGYGTIFTYADMSNRVAAIASGIRKLEVPPGSVIGVFQEPTAGFVCSLLAVWHAGCVYMPLDLATPMPRLETQVHHCSPQLILVDNRHENAAASFGTSVFNVSSCIGTKETSDIVLELPGADSTDPAAILYTSGSTGVPKGIILSHRNLIHELEFSSKSYDFEIENVLCQSALGFDMSLTQIFTALAYGGCVHMVTLAERGDALSITKRIVDDGITFTGATPSEYLLWLAYGVGNLGQSSWRRAVCGGEPITPALLRSFASIANPQLRLFNAYGPTETTCSVTRVEIPYHDLSQASSKIQLTVGHVAPNCSVCIVDSDLRPLPIGMPGEVLIGGVKVAVGYFGNDALTQERFLNHAYVPDQFVAEGWVSVHRTGDVGRILSDGQLVLEGRVAGDSQIKLRGNRVDLTDVEDAILRAGQGHLIEALVCVPTKTDSGDASSDSVLLAALVVTDASFEHNSTKEESFLIDVLRRVDLPRALRPAIIRSAQALPKSLNGKADRKAAAELIRMHLDTTVAPDDDESLSAVESQLQHAWTEVLPFKATSKIRRSTDFFHAGGNSLLLVALQKKIQEVFNVKLSLVSLFDQSTFSNMASMIEQDFIKETRINWDTETNPENCIPTEYLRLSKAHTLAARGPAVLVLTGATGFLGKALLQALVPDERISTIHCIAVRKTVQLEPFSASGKVVVHKGDLTLPRLGLSKDMAQSIFSTADIIIHNGADVSHLKSYQTIKSANVGSTQELVKLTLEHGRPIPFHFVSTAGVPVYSGLETFGEVSAAPFPPPTDNSDGYTASKWASERFLERVHGLINFPVWVHRPSNIHRFEDPQFDLFQNLLRYSRLLQAVPKFSSMQGHLNLVEVVDVAHGIRDDIFNDSNLKVNYRHQKGKINLSMDKLADFVSDQTKSDVEVLDVYTWADRAESYGLSETVSEWFKKVALGVPVKYPLLVCDRD